MFQQVACLSVDAQVGHMYVATRVWNNIALYLSNI